MNLNTHRELCTFCSLFMIHTTSIQLQGELYPYQGPCAKYVAGDGETKLDSVNILRTVSPLFF